MDNSLLYEFEDRFNHLIELDKTDEKDFERQALFCVLAGNLDLYKKVNLIYDFKARKINRDCLDSEEVDFCSSSRKLIKLAFNLYNSSNTADVSDTFYLLDDENFNLALKAIKVRFNRGEENELLYSR